MLHLILAGLWLLLGVGLLLWTAVDPNARLPGVNRTVVGCAALALAAYNLFRFWLAGRMRGSNTVAASSPRHTPSSAPRDPAFDFEQPPQEQPGPER